MSHLCDHAHNLGYEMQIQWTGWWRQLLIKKHQITSLIPWETRQRVCYCIILSINNHARCAQTNTGTSLSSGPSGKWRSVHFHYFNTRQHIVRITANYHHLNFMFYSMKGRYLVCRSTLWSWTNHKQYKIFQNYNLFNYYKFLQNSFTDIPNDFWHWKHFRLICRHYASKTRCDTETDVTWGWVHAVFNWCNLQLERAG